MPVYHVELRHFPNVARAFNLDRETLERRFLRPWVGGELIDYEQRRWSPEKTRLKVLEGKQLDPSVLGIGRSWGSANKQSHDVTEQVLADIRRGAEARPEVDALMLGIEQVATSPIAFPDVIAMATAAQPLWRASEQLALAEQAVWEMLHRGRLQLVSAGEPVPREGWQPIVLRWAIWTGQTPEPIRLRVPFAPGSMPPGSGATAE